MGVCLIIAGGFMEINFGQNQSQKGLAESCTQMQWIETCVLCTQQQIKQFVSDISCVFLGNLHLVK